MGIDITSSTLLNSQPSFFKGVSRLSDINGSLDSYKEYKTGNLADIAAIRSDWSVIGKDMEEAIKSINEQEISKK